MKVKYRLYPFGMLPMLKVVLKNGSKTYPLEALVDSGAGKSLFSLEVAKELGIDLKKCPTQEYDGIGGMSVKGYIRTISLKIPQFDEWIDIEAGFVPKQFALIGHVGFFDSYEVIFRTYQNTLEIKRKPGAKDSAPQTITQLGFW